MYVSVHICLQSQNHEITQKSIVLVVVVVVLMVEVVVVVLLLLLLLKCRASNFPNFILTNFGQSSWK
jgi:heme/copper-type cytochrome/quinol oxidase subunit 2